MADDLLRELLERNDRHCGELPEACFDAIRDGQAPPVVSVCCSDSRVSQEGMWATDEPGWLFTVSNIGNQVWLGDGDDRIVSGSVAYPIAHTGTRTAVVVGHTGCGAVTAAYDAVVNGVTPEPIGVRAELETLVPLVEAALEDGVVTSADDRSAAINRLVEHSVTRQTAFLAADPDLPDDLDVYGFVYDFHGAYGETDGATYLVAANDVADVEALRDRVDDELAAHVARLG
ncbi:carbonic anhydrase [Haloferacaceae archaeon DSL9]